MTNVEHTNFPRHGACFAALALLATLALPATGTVQDQDSTASAADESRFLSNVRQLTFEGRRAGEGYFSKDGSRLVFQSERDPGNPFFQIFLMDLETGDVEQVSPGHGKTTCAWIHPDGERVLFASTHDDPAAREKQREELALREKGEQRRYAWDYDEHFDIYVRQLDSGKLTNLTDTRGYDAEGSYSPDGKLIAFSSNRHAYENELPAEDRERLAIDKSYFLDIYIMNSDGSNVRRLTDAPGYDGGPFFSPDGQRICWRRFSEDGTTAEVFTMKIDGSDERQLTRLGALSWAPFYHPSGDYLIFTTNRHGFANFELYLVDAAGQREPVRVTTTEGFDGLPVFSPDGRKLVWTSNRTPENESQLFIADWNHTAARQSLTQASTRTQGTRALAGAAQQDVPAAQTEPAIRAEDIRAHVAYLASESLEGRLTGTEGERLATEYVARHFQQLGLDPAGTAGYFHPFAFTAGVALGEDNRLTLHADGDGDAQAPQVDEDWRPLAFSATGEFGPADVVFAGYGITAAASGDQEAYDSYAHLDVKDRWVLALRFIPEDIPPDRRRHLNRYAALRYKTMLARDNGALGLIIASGPTSQVKSQLVEMTTDAASGDVSIPVISVSDSFAQQLLSPAGRELKALQQNLDGGAQETGFTLDGIRLGAKIDIQKVEKTGRNVLGILSSGNPNAPAVLVGAHVDHLGRGESAGSLARDAERGQIHYGADDNASGVAGMLEIAEYLAAQVGSGKLSPKRNVVFAAWSGEELGRLGSDAFVKHVAETTGSGDDIRSAFAAALNLDMIGRLEDAVVVSGVGSSSVWPREIERRNVPVGLKITAEDNAYLPTDSTSFYVQGVPTLSMFTGAHEDYHTPRDTAEKLNYEGAARIAKLTGLIARSLAAGEEVPDFVAMKAEKPGSARAGLRAYLGTIPEYTGDGPGVALSGVSKDGPAEQAGVRGGDAIVELAGKKIENIYDYTYALDALKIGEPVTIVVLRDGERVELKITPGSRE